MDLRTGKLYDSVEDARVDGVPESDIARIETKIDARGQITKLLPKVSFEDLQRRRARRAANEVRRRGFATSWPAK